MLPNKFEDFYESRVKFGVAQKMAVLSCAIVELAEGSEMMIIGFLNPILQT